jgi:hypothetical protein
MQQPDKNKSKIKPVTRGDSLVVYNSTVKFENKLKELKYKKTSSFKSDINNNSQLYGNIYSFNNNDIKINPNYVDLEELKKNIYKDSKGDIYLKPTVPRKGTTNYGNINVNNKPVLKKIDDNRYLTIEDLAYIGYNTDLPNIILDKRIKPQKIEGYDLNDGNKRDVISFSKYDKLAVKPFDLLTEKEKVKRVEEYGTDGVPQSYLNKTKNNTSTNTNTTNKPYTNKPTATYSTKPTATYSKPREKVEAIKPLPSASIKTGSNTLYSDVKVIRKARTPKAYKVETSGGSKSNKWRTTQTVSTPDNIGANDGDTRKIVPLFGDGGKINTINVMRKPRLNSRKRYISPAVIGAGVNVGMGLIQGALQRGAPIKARSNALNQMWKEKSVSDAQSFDDYTKNIDDVIDYYADGGKLPTLSSMGKYNTTGGKLKPIADGVVEVQGNKHGEKTIDNSYGVTLHKGNQPIAEVEDKEVMVEQPDGDMVFSARLKDEKGVSFANRMKQLAKKRNKLEKDLDKNYDTKSRNSIERKLAGLNMAEEVLKIKQEEVKFEEGQAELDKLANGGKIPKYANGTMNLGDTDNYLSKNNKQMWKDILPTLADNAGNMLLTLNTPKLAKPIRKSAVNLNTNYNINPQLSEVKNEINAITDNIYKNTSNSNIARANISSARLRGLQQTNNILGQKENIENQLKNQNKLNKQQVEHINIDADNNNNMLEFTRANDIHSRISANLADMSSDFKEGQTRRDYNAYYDESMLLELLDDPTGVKARHLMNNPYLKAKYGKYFTKPSNTVNPRRKRIDTNFNNNNTVIGTTYLPRRIDANFN